MNKISFEYKETKKLIPYAKNSRLHSTEQVEKIAKSISKFGFLNPIIIDDNDGIIAGHGRVMAAKKLDINVLPVVKAQHLSEAQKQAYIIADNRLALDASWDNEILTSELQELQLQDFDIDLLGFNDLELEELNISPHEMESEALTDEDFVPDLPDEPVSVLGDIWTLGNHRLMCGDSTSVDEVEKLMDGQRAQICFTSPPYNVGSMNIKGNERTKEKYKSYNDKKNDDDFYDFLSSNLSCMMNYSDEIFYNIGLVQNNKKTIFKIVNDFSDVFKDIIYWKNYSIPKSFYIYFFFFIKID